MEKFYCDHCRLLYNQEDPCLACGSLVKKKIVIEVQKQKNLKHFAIESD